VSSDPLERLEDAYANLRRRAKALVHLGAATDKDFED
jgi:hypothetical protein